MRAWCALIIGFLLIAACSLLAIYGHFVKEDPGAPIGLGLAIIFGVPTVLMLWRSAVADGEHVRVARIGALLAVLAFPSLFVCDALGW